MEIQCSDKCETDLYHTTLDEIRSSFAFATASGCSDAKTSVFDERQFHAVPYSIHTGPSWYHIFDELRPGWTTQVHPRPFARPNTHSDSPTRSNTGRTPRWRTRASCAQHHQAGSLA
eukprot:6186321-Pleurochrysis_carterae.AAC.2